MLTCNPGPETRDNQKKDIEFNKFQCIILCDRFLYYFIFYFFFFSCIGRTPLLQAWFVEFSDHDY